MWQDRARCLNSDTEVFFPPRTKGVYQDYAEQARQFCFGRVGVEEGLCPVILECLVFALKNEEVHGIWGGLSSRERSGLRSRNVLPKWLENYDEESVRRVQSAIVGTIEEVFEYLEEADSHPGSGGEAPPQTDE